MSGVFLPTQCKEFMVSPSEPAAVAYRGLIEMHAQQLQSCERFKRTGRMTPNEVHVVARDLAELGRSSELDSTIHQILARTDALELERANKADAEFRKRLALASDAER